MVIYNTNIYDLSTSDAFGSGGSFDAFDGTITVSADRSHNINVEDDDSQIDASYAFGNESTPWLDAIYRGGTANDVRVIQSTCTLSDGTLVSPGWTITARSGEGGVLNATTGQSGYITNSRLDPPDGTDLAGANFRLANAFVGLNLTLGDVIEATNDTSDNTKGSAFYNGLGVLCFTTDVPIQTPFGYIIADKLQAWDFVTTADHEEQQIRWIGKRHIDSIDMVANPKLRPIRISKGALGAGLPTKDILVSRQHRMLVQSQMARDIFGVDEVLVPAIKLIEWPGIEIADDVSEVTYIYFLFDRHEIVFAAGVSSESLFIGSEAMKALSDDMRQEIFSLFPKLESTGHAFAPAQELLSSEMSQNLIAQYAKTILPAIKESPVRRDDIQYRAKQTVAIRWVPCTSTISTKPFARSSFEFLNISLQLSHQFSPHSKT